MSKYLPIFRAVIWRAGDWWLCHVLDVDMATQARTIDAAVDHLRICFAIERQCDGDLAFTHRRPAPERFWRMYKEQPGERRFFTESDPILEVLICEQEEPEP